MKFDDKVDFSAIGFMALDRMPPIEGHIGGAILRHRPQAIAKLVLNSLFSLQLTATMRRVDQTNTTAIRRYGRYQKKEQNRSKVLISTSG